MVIDNAKQSSVNQQNALTNHNDKTVSRVVVTQVTADESTRICAENIADIKAVANNITNILTQTREFNDKYNALQKTMPNSNKKAIEVLDESVVKFTADLVMNIDKVCEISNDITDLAQMKDVMQNLLKLENVMTKLNDNLDILIKLGANVDNIQIVANLSEKIARIVLIEDKLITLYDNIHQLETLYNYLPELLQIYAWIVQYQKSQAKNNFTDDEFFTSVIKLTKNLEELINLSVNVKDLLAVKKQLDDAPNLLANIKAELATLETQYSANLRDEFTNYKRELGVFVADTKIQIGELLGLLKGTIAGSNNGNTGGGNSVTIAEVLANIKQGAGIVITRDLKNDTIVIQSDIKEFNVDSIEAGNNIQIVKKTDGGITINNSQKEFDIKTIKAGNNIEITDNVDGGITINGQAGGGGDTEIGDFDVVKDWDPNLTPSGDVVGGDTEINNFDTTQNWETNLNPSGSENPMVEISGFGNAANW